VQPRIFSLDPNGSSPLDIATKPTGVRHLVMGLTTLAAVLLYLDRFCISFAERYIKEDLNLSNEQIGWILSAFFWTYALAQVPSGYLTDRFGARVTLTLYILLWSLFTGLTGLATGFVVLMLLRFGFGVAQAGGYPASASLISKWVPIATRGFASSLVACGGRIGGFMAPMVTAFLIVLFVPASVSSLLRPTDILDYTQLCYELTHKELKAGQILLAYLPSDQQEIITLRGQQHQAWLELQKKKTKITPPPPYFLAEEEGELVSALNPLLQKPNLFQEFSFHNHHLPGEAESLRQKSASELTPSQVERLNRLLLETLFPQGIKKIYGQGWRPTMIVFGLVGMLVAALFCLWFRDRPDLHPRCNAAEVSLLAASQPAQVSRQAHRLPLTQLMRSGSMWLMCLSQIGTNIGWIFLVTWLPRYLDEVHRLPIGQRSVLTSLPILAGWVGMLGGGWFTDWFARRVGLRCGRAWPIALTRFGATAAYLVCVIYPDLWVITIAFCLVAFMTDFGIPAMWAFNLDIGGRYVGSVLGWGNMWGNLGAAVSPPLMNWVVGVDQWDQAFLLCAAAFFVSGVCSLGINASVPLVSKDEPNLAPNPPSRD
jgi:ACS family glucarate transporter-like MFS transporter